MTQVALRATQTPAPPPHPTTNDTIMLWWSGAEAGRVVCVHTSEHPDKTQAMTGTIALEITDRLTTAFAPRQLQVINDSASHHGHAGHDGSGESHFTVVIESAAFAGQSRLQRQRAVIAALGDIPGQRVHALAIRARAPGE
jgi:BolA protein